MRPTILAVLATMLGGCSCSSSETSVAQEPALAAAASADVDAPPPFVLSQSAKIAPLLLQTNIYERPNRTAKKLGTLRLGQTAPRSEQPVPGADCVGEWYGTDKGGYICAGSPPADPNSKMRPLPEATLDLNDKLIKALGVKPDISKPMPYRYGFVRANSALYVQIPRKKEQDRYEYAVRGHRKMYAKMHEKWDKPQHGGPNAVPLDDTGIALTPPEGEYPPAPELSDEDKFGVPHSPEPPWWLAPSPRSTKRDRFDRAIPNISSYAVPDYAVAAGRIYRHAGVAIIGSFESGKRGDDRRFTVTVDGRLMPADKLKPHYASAFHGVRIDGDKVKLPFAWVKVPEAYSYEMKEDKVRWPRTGKLTFRSIIPLTGKIKRYPSARYLETTDGRWVNVKEVAYVDVLSEPPKEFNYKKTKWIDVSIWQQTLVAYEGEKPVFATLVSTGVDGMDDPKTTKSTVRGAFRIDQKHVTATMDAEDPEHRFELRDVPWVQYFEQGYALHAAYWHDDFGRPRSHGCVNMSPIDARWLFFWTEPSLPENWHSVFSRPNTGEGTWVRVRG